MDSGTEKSLIARVQEPIRKVSDIVKVLVIQTGTSVKGTGSVFVMEIVDTAVFLKVHFHRYPRVP